MPDPAVSDPAAEDRARARFIWLNIVNFSCVGLAMLGVLIVSGRVAGLPEAAGYTLLIAGAAAFFAAPRALRRRWAQQGRHCAQQESDAAP